MKPMASCCLFGAYRACAGITDAVLLFHSVIGCSWGTMTYHITNHMNEIHQASSVVYEEDVIDGGEKILRQALLNIEELYPSARVIVVISGCVPNMIGDDVRGIISSIPLTKPVIVLDSPGFSGGDEAGFENALLALGQQMKKQSKLPHSVNLLGFSIDDFKAEADIKAICGLLGKKVTVHTAVGCDGYENVLCAPQAELNIVFQRGIQLAEYMKKTFGIPYIVVDYPYGIAGCTDFLQQIGLAMNIDFSAEIAKLNEGIKAILQRTTHYLQTLYGMPAAVIGDRVHMSGLQKFLTAEIGMDIAVSAEQSDQDGNEIYNKIRQSSSVLIFGSSFERELSEEMKIPLFRYSYPVFDKVDVGGVPYVGLQGTAALLEDMINLVLAADYKTNGVYPIIPARIQMG